MSLEIGDAMEEGFRVVLEFPGERRELVAVLVAAVVRVLNPFSWKLGGVEGLDIWYGCVDYFVTHCTVL